jgi:transposase-like protein
MQTYNPATKCPKCGHDKVETSYRDTLDLLRRTCERCSYNWQELPLDSVGQVLPISPVPVIALNDPVTDKNNDLPF